MSRIKIYFTLLLITLCYPNAILAQEKGNAKYYEVTWIIDGDTFWIINGPGPGLKIRLIGIDAPESRNTGDRKKSEFGDDATGYLAKLIGESKVRIEYDLDSTDRYGRTLAYVYTENGSFINAEMLKAGYAAVMTVKPNSRYEQMFIKLEKRAKKKGRGMWVQKY